MHNSTSKCLARQTKAKRRAGASMQSGGGEIRLILRDDRDAKAERLGAADQAADAASSSSTAVKVAADE